ncbi:site-specific DNA-methyltransferase [Gallibacterium anatis]|uniref:site-specific DNA-methyltransferase n=2 Tax=Gallibacterium anatis TaxID=750 RepID=UPI002E77B88A|nr:site-specific DNA-methyltransferase [Gallibacterium anatis]
MTCYSKSFPAVWSGGVERYQLNWPGKREALLTANAPIAKTLRPVREESVHFDSTENLFIEGDNLDALKLLQETYLGKVKMIYIDPPYNTGKDFVYADDFAENTEDYLRRSNQKDEDGNRMEVNSESNGRFHSDWLSMMYPRLKLARNLLTDDGVIFISIDDNEQANLKRLCDEVFGENNFVANIAWRRTDNQSNIGTFAKVKDTIIVYAKNSFDLELGKLPLSEKALKEYRYSDEKGRFRRNILLHKTRGRHFYDVVTKSGNVLNGPWMIKEENFYQLEKQGLIYWTSGGDEQPYGKLYLSEKNGQIPSDFWGIEFGTNQRGSLEVEDLFGRRVFDFPKPVSLLKNFLNLGTNPNLNDIILDFFAGSGTTAHAVMQLNAEDGGNRRFICVQLPEKTDEKSEAFKAGFATIAEITKERIRRAADKIRSDFADKLPENWDGGFRVLKTDTSNMADVYYTPEETLKKMQQSQQDWLNQVSDNIKPDRTPEDLLFQVMLDWGVGLALPIEVKQIMGRTVFFVDGNTLIACFDKQAVDNDFITALTQYRPLRVVFRDDSFKDDAAKINTSQIFQQYSESTEVKTI